MPAARLRFRNACTSEISEDDETKSEPTTGDGARSAANPSSIAATGKMLNKAPIQSTGALRQERPFLSQAANASVRAKGNISQVQILPSSTIPLARLDRLFPRVV